MREIGWIVLSKLGVAEAPGGLRSADKVTKVGKYRISQLRARMESKIVHLKRLNRFPS